MGLVQIKNNSHTFCFKVNLNFPESYFFLKNVLIFYKQENSEYSICPLALFLRKINIEQYFRK